MATTGDIWYARKWLDDIRESGDGGDSRAFAALTQGLHALEFLRELQGELAGEEIAHARVRPRRLKLSRRIAEFLRG
jgi:hypothetical protein